MSRKDNLSQGTKMAARGAEEHLKKHVGFMGLLAMCVGLNIGGALFALTTVAAGLSGPSLPVAMVISAVPVLLALVPYLALTSAVPTTSATYRYSQIFSPALALISMFSLLVCILIGGQPLFALAFGKYLGALVPLDPIPTGVLVLTVFYLINLLGVKLTMKVQTGLFFVLLSALFLYISLGLPRIQPVHFSGFFSEGAKGTLAASGLLFTFCAGGLFVIDLGGEVLNARKTFSRALPLGIGVAVLLYVLVGLVTVGVGNWRALEGKSLIEVADRFMSEPVLAYFIVGGALVACATTINIIFTIISRGVLVVSQEGLLPAFLGVVNHRFGTPHWALTMSYLVCTTSLIVVPSLLFFGAMLNLGLILSITVVALAGFVAPARFPGLFQRSGPNASPARMKVACLVTVILNTLIFAFLAFAVGKSSLVFFGIVFLSFLYSRVLKGRLREIRERLFEAEGTGASQPFWMQPREGPDETG
jgi:APA family basic amino acid/polyamine antiporter